MASRASGTSIWLLFLGYQRFCGGEVRRDFLSVKTGFRGMLMIQKGM